MREKHNADGFVGRVWSPVVNKMPGSFHALALIHRLQAVTSRRNSQSCSTADEQPVLHFTSCLQHLAYLAKARHRSLITPQCQTRPSSNQPNHVHKFLVNPNSGSSVLRIWQSSPTVRLMDWHPQILDTLASWPPRVRKVYGFIVVSCFKRVQRSAYEEPKEKSSTHDKLWPDEQTNRMQFRTLKRPMSNPDSISSAAEQSLRHCDLA